MIQMSRDPSRIGTQAATTSEKGCQPQAVLEFEGGGAFNILDVATVGRAPDSQVVLEERSVSRHHARIFYEGGHYWLKDLDSANGTTLNNNKIKLQMLSDSDRIAFGEAKAQFHFSGTAGPALIASDPLDGASTACDDGTPTSGLAGKSASAEEAHIHQLGQELAAARQEAASKEQENERLRKLVKQLERTMADSNLRLRNLQELLNQRKG